jgi:ubiquinone/menaquinone biosynthesis C-methylase UbiE/uncharacterized protein YbaR (Trm112 family)
MDFCCPNCKGTLALSETAYFCGPCDKSYPIVMGIPDFRVFPDPYIDIEDDWKKAEYLGQHYEELDFVGLVRLYWEITPEVSQDRAERFIRRAVSLTEKGVQSLKELEAAAPKRRSNVEGILEIGCGTGGFLVAAKRKYDDVVGTDIAFRWLVVARKRLQELSVNVPLVCCCAEFMPFRNGRFQIILAEDVIEHVKDQKATLQECHRVLSHDGAVFLATPNRYSLSPEPHVRVWGVGLLPRRWMNAYVRLVKGIAYEGIRVLSFMELKRLLRNCQFEDHRIMLPSISEEERRYFSKLERLQLHIYNTIKRIPVIRAVLYLVGPFFTVVAFRHEK